MSSLRENDSQKILEFPLVLQEISRLASSETGREKIQNLLPFDDQDLLKAELERITEFKDLFTFDDPFPFSPFDDLRSYLKRAEVVGSFLNPRAFVSIHDFIVMCRMVKQYFVERPDKYKLLQKQIKTLLPAVELEKEIARAIDPHARVKDKASEDLYRLRKSLMRKTTRAKSRLQSIHRALFDRGAAQDDALALREGRLVIPVKENARGEIQGLIVDQSASGATVFMEPLEVLEINNEIRQLRIQEQHEIERILKSLTDRVREHRLILKDNWVTAVELDSLSARARYSLEVNASPAETPADGQIVLKEAYHPLLLMREKRESVVPLTLEMGNALKTVVITGPNAGGKTVTLKTVGLLALMHQHGLHLPAAPGTLMPLIQRVFADIGDQQSIEQDLSTFSSHITTINRILHDVSGNTLVLLDEIGSSTDPNEGAALARSVLKYLTEQGCLTIATTHMSSLKVFAHEENGVENGSMAFDQETLKPTYRFQMGLPGSSYAFEIAERLGMPPAVIDDARHHLGEDRGNLDGLILSLEKDVERARQLLAESEIKESRLSGLVKLYQEKVEAIETEGEERKREILGEADDILHESNAIVERVVKEIREKQAGKDSIRNAKQALEEQRRRIKVMSVKKAKQDALVLPVGERVTWHAHRGSGEVLSKPDNSGRILVQWEDVKLRIPGSELEALKTERKKSEGFSSYYFSESVSDEVDLRGMTADEAIDSVTRYMGEAGMAGLKKIRIIHGKGTGVLRKEITRFLSGHNLVKSKRLGNWNEGDTGVTIVELK